MQEQDDTEENAPGKDGEMWCCDVHWVNMS